MEVSCLYHGTCWGGQGQLEGAGSLLSHFQTLGARFSDKSLFWLSDLAGSDFLQKLPTLVGASEPAHS